jgi:hypothetical protein
MYNSGRTLSVRQSDFNQLTFCSYLWIDSLCIIQDSKEDWANECSHMAGVYTNSYLTIAAVSCKDSLEEFIEADPTYPNIQCKLTAISGAPGHFLFIRPYHGFEYWHVLLDRAWVMLLVQSVYGSLRRYLKEKIRIL